MDEMSRRLAVFVREAEALGASPCEALGALIHCATEVYAHGASGADGRAEQRSAKLLFVNAMERAMRGLPTAAKDANIEARLAFIRDTQ